MLNKQIKKIYELTNDSILTPENLVNNIKLDIYKEIKYYTKDNKIFCEMKSVEDEEEVSYLYEFSLDGKLIKAISKTNTETDEFFNREKELDISIEEYYKVKNNVKDII